MTKTRKPSILSPKALIGGIAGISLVAVLALAPVGFAYASGGNDSNSSEAGEVANPAREAAETSMSKLGINMEKTGKEIVDSAQKGAKNSKDTHGGKAAAQSGDHSNSQGSVDKNAAPMKLSDFISSIRKGVSVLSSQVANANLELVYSNGWKEEIDHGRYVLVDPNNNKIISRLANKADISRMRSASK